VLAEPSVSDQLCKDVFQLAAGRGRGIKLLEQLVEVGAAPFRPLNGAQDFLG
jgi:hypothetical protein